MNLVIFIALLAADVCATQWDKQKLEATNNFSQKSITVPRSSNEYSFSLEQFENDFGSRSSSFAANGKEDEQRKKVEDNEKRKTLTMRKRRRKRGLLKLNFGRHSSFAGTNVESSPNDYFPIHGLRKNEGESPPPPILRVSSNRARILPKDKANKIPDTINEKDEGCSLTVDAPSAGRLLLILLSTTGSIISASLSSLQLVATLILSRGVLVGFGNFLTDYLRGRYFRKAYTRIEMLAIRYYELPAALRALSRVTSHIFVLLFLSTLLGWLMSIAHVPCKIDRGSLQFIYVFFWISTVLRTGDAYSSAISVWGGPLRVQASIGPRNRSRRDKIMRLLRNPGQWIEEPDKWTKVARYLESFYPNPSFFPVAWTHLRILQIMVMARILSMEPCESSWKIIENEKALNLMKSFLIQSGLRDEWLLVFFREKRVGLAMIVICAYFIASSSFVIKCARVNLKIAAWCLPSIISLLISGWMNVVIFWNRLEEKKKNAIRNSLPFSKRRAQNTLNDRSPYIY